MRALADRSEESKYYQLQGVKELRELRLLPVDARPFNTEVNIYGNKVAILTFGKEFVGVIMESEEIAATWRMVFEVIWKFVEKE